MKKICSINGEIKDESDAVLPLSQIEAQYGFGVYETIKLRNSVLYFVEQHIERLFHSASLLSLQHTFQEKQLITYIKDFVRNLNEDSSNLKLLLYGNKDPQKATFIILASSPLYPNRKLYKEGVNLLSYQYERWLPQAKSLNMVASYYIYTKARESDCYDALLYDRNGNILEGTRTNVYLIKGKQILSPPKEKILEGVTLKSLEKVLLKSDYKLAYQDVQLEELSSFDGMFITSSSSKILPVKQVDQVSFKEISAEIHTIMKLYDDALERSGGVFDTL